MRKMVQRIHEKDQSVVVVKSTHSGRPDQKMGLLCLRSADNHYRESFHVYVRQMLLGQCPGQSELEVEVSAHGGDETLHDRANGEVEV